MKRTTVYVMPWDDEAVASLHPSSHTDNLAEVIGTGTLLSVALDLATQKATTLKRARLSLPNRERSPFSFQGMALLRLIADARAKAGVESKTAS